MFRLAGTTLSILRRARSACRYLPTYIYPIFLSHFISLIYFILFSEYIVRIWSNSTAAISAFQHHFSLPSFVLLGQGTFFFPLSLSPSLFFPSVFLFRTNTYIQVDGTTSFSKLKVMAEGGGSKTVTLTPTWTQFTLLLNASGLNAPSPFGGNSHKFQFQNSQASMSFYFGSDEGRDEGRGGRDEWITYFV